MKNIKDICTQIICEKLFSKEQHAKIVSLLKEKTKNKYSDDVAQALDFEEIVKESMHRQVDTFLSKMNYDEAGIKFLIEDMKYLNPEDFI